MQKVTVDSSVDAASATDANGASKEKDTGMYLQHKLCIQYVKYCIYIYSACACCIRDSW